MVDPMEAGGRRRLLRSNSRSAFSTCALYTTLLLCWMDFVALSSRHAALFIPEDAPQPALRTLAEAVPRVPAAWRALSPHGEFRPSQEDTLEAIASGRDVVSRQPTGSGKSLCAQLPALAEWCADWRARVDLASEEARD